MRHTFSAHILLLVLAISCNNSVKTNEKSRGASTERRQPVPSVSLVDIDRPADGTELHSGEVIDLELSLVSDTIPDSVRIFLDGYHIGTLEKGILGHKVRTDSVRLGEVSLKVMAYLGEKRPQTVTHILTVFSDIEPAIYGYRVINEYPHDKTAYTQGLLYHKGFLYESTGGEGESTLRKVELTTGEALKVHNLESKFFGEGLVLYDSRLYQLTWRNKVGFVYDIQSFRELRRVHYSTQGWGLATDGEYLIMSDGTNKLYFLEPQYFTVLSSIEVYDNKDAVWQLNELEYIEGEIWANIYMTDRIARIDPATGKVLAYVDLSNILSDEHRHSELAELNGIAWDSDKERLFVTGKNWPRLFEISLVKRR